MLRKTLTIVLAASLISVLSIPAMAGSSSSANSNSQAAGTALIDQSGQNNISESMERGFVVPGGVGYGPVINYYGKPLPTAQFRPVETLLMYGGWFSEGTLEKIVSRSSDTITECEVVNGAKYVPRAKADPNGTRWIRIIATTAVQEKHGLVGYVTSEADDRKTSMLEVVAQAALDALRSGADILQVTAQGAARDTETSGWGIGFNTTAAKMFDGDNVSGVASGGTGYSSAWAGMRDKPWIQANALVSPEPVWKDLEAAKPEKKAEKPAAEKPAVKAEKPAAKTPVKVVKAPEKQTGNHVSN